MNTTQTLKGLTALLLLAVLILFVWLAVRLSGGEGPLSPNNSVTTSEVLTTAIQASPQSISLTETVTVEAISPRKAVFDGERALELVAYQVDLGPRLPGSQSHRATIEWIRNELLNYGWMVEVMESERLGHLVKNVVARRGQGKSWIVLGAHYDSRLVADQDPEPDKRELPVSGANDGASGVAVLLELGRVIPESLDKEVWLVFFDVEDNGDLPGWDWILGSRAFVEGLQSLPDAAVIVDMVGDSDLTLYLEKNSDKRLANEIWSVAASLGYRQFIPSEKYSILDDHTPFLQAGVPAVDIIDFDYPYWHTTQDTIDKISAESLEAVGATLLVWLSQTSLMD